ncbi:MAG: hypothetical protein ACFFBU_07115 [Promethearchaeota archaeon]
MVTVSTSTVTRWEYRRVWNYIRTSILRPIYITVQIISVIIVLIIMWLLWFLLLDPYGLSYELRDSLYLFVRETGIIGPSAIWFIYAILSLLVAQQIVKATLGVPLGSESEPADADFLFPAPMPGHVFYTAKYLRSISRRLIFFIYIFVAIQPIIWFFMRDYGLSIPFIALMILLSFLLAEIGAIAAQGLYALRKFVSQSRPYRRIYRIVFYVALVIGIVLLLSPFWVVSGVVLSSPMYNLAYLFVSLAFSGLPLMGLLPGWWNPVEPFTYLYVPALPWLFLGLFIAYLLILLITRWLTNRITVDMYEEIAAITRHRGTARGALSRLPITFKQAKSPLRSVFKKDFITGLRKPGKTFYLFGILVNIIAALTLTSLLPTLNIVVPLPPSFLPIMETLYALLLVIIIPLLSINASDPFQGERGTLYLLRLSDLSPFWFTFSKYLQFLVTPIFLAIPFAIYFAVVLGSLELFPVAFAILPHAILISTAIGISLGSRYPHSSRVKNEIPVALMVTYPILSWIVIMPVLIFQLGFLPAGVEFMLLSSLLVIPYTLGLLLILIRWSAHSYIRQG